MIDVPPEDSKDFVYKGSFGHKVNHSFQPNSMYTLFDSPRYGLVQAVKTLENVREGEELFANYGYKTDSIGQPKWYRDLFRQFSQNQNDIGTLKVLQRIDEDIRYLDGQDLKMAET